VTKPRTLPQHGDPGTGNPHIPSGSCRRNSSQRQVAMSMAVCASCQDWIQPNTRRRLPRARGAGPRTRADLLQRPAGCFARRKVAAQAISTSRAAPRTCPRKNGRRLAEHAGDHTGKMQRLQPLGIGPPAGPAGGTRVCHRAPRRPRCGPSARGPSHLWPVPPLQSRACRESFGSP
jgi:hypothetical protein